MAHIEGYVMLGAAVLAVVVAAIVLAASPRRAVNRLLAFYLVLIAFNFGVDSSHVLTSDETLLYNAEAYNHATNIVVPLTYLLFVGAALGTPLTAPLRARVVRWGFAAAAVAVFVWIFAFHSHFTSHVVIGPAGEAFSLPPQWFFSVVTYLWIGAALFGLTASLNAFFRAPKGSLSRRRAKAYAFAFGAQDVGFVVFPLLGFGPHLFHTTYGYSVSLILAVVLLMRALLRDQLFDFELKVKWTLKQSTIGAVFVAVFFIVSEGAQEVFQERVGPYVGIAAAGLLVFALAPLQRVAERVANAAMPGVQPTQAYVQFKKFEVYRAAVESAHETGGIDERERAVLDRLRTKLEIAAEDAAAVELEAVRA